MKAYLDMWKRSFDFFGRTGRRDYWVACFTGIGINMLISLACGMLYLIAAFCWELSVEQLLPYFELPISLYRLAYLVPYLAMSVRRVRDAGYTSKLLILCIIPPLGLFAIFARLFMKSAEEETATQIIDS